MNNPTTVEKPQISPSAAQFTGIGELHSMIKIGVSGAAESTHCGLDVFEVAKEVGREIVQHGAALVTGATTGFPFYASMGAKEAGGLSIGLSPAATEREHVEVYRLPLDYMDVIIYTGFGFSGRDILFVRASDAMIFGCGRIGTVNEFVVAFEDRRPIGILEGAWKMDEILKSIIEGSNRKNNKIIYDSDPKALVERLIEVVKKERKGVTHVYDNHDGWSGTGKGNLIL